jgi:hypothetical protein
MSYTNYQNEDEEVMSKLAEFQANVPDELDHVAAEILSDSLDYINERSPELSKVAAFDIAAEVTVDILCDLLDENQEKHAGYDVPSINLTVEETLELAKVAAAIAHEAHITTEEVEARTDAEGEAFGEKLAELTERFLSEEV